MIAPMSGASTAVEWLAPSALEEALDMRAQRGADCTVVAGGSFLAILMNQGFVQPTSLLSLRCVEGLDAIAMHDGELRLGAMVSHRAVERDATVRRHWPMLADAFGLVASPRVRNQATVGGVLAEDNDPAAPDERWGEVVLAIVVLKPGAGPAEQDLLDFTQGRLARYKQPRHVVFVEALPRNPAGKVLKFELRERVAELPLPQAAAATAG